MGGPLYADHRLRSGVKDFPYFPGVLKYVKENTSTSVCDHLFDVSRDGNLAGYPGASKQPGKHD